MPSITDASRYSWGYIRDNEASAQVTATAYYNHYNCNTYFINDWFKISNGKCQETSLGNVLD